MTEKRRREERREGRETGGERGRGKGGFIRKKVYNRTFTSGPP